MKLVLFVGTKIGQKGLECLIELGASILHVFIDTEAQHESDKYDSKIIDICMMNSIEYSINASKQDIEKITDSVEIDYIFCFGFRRLIDQIILRKVKCGSLSTHFSLLPRYRGFAPVNWAIINGEKECGVSLFHMEDEADSGDIVAQKRIEIEEDEYVDDVMNKCINSLKKILIEEWPELSKGNVKRIKQDTSQATITCSRNPEDGIIDWNESTENIYNLIRGTSKPFPGAFTHLVGEKLTIWKAEPYDAGNFIGRIPGKVIQLHKNKGVVVLTGDGALLIKIVQYQGNFEANTADQIVKSVRITLG